MSKRKLTEAEQLAYEAMALAARQLREAQRQAEIARHSEACAVSTLTGPNENEFGEGDNGD